MSTILSIHSFRGGTGKSNTAANVAALAAADGLRVGVVDADIQSPGIHVLFGIDHERVERSLNDYLWGRCEIEEAAHDVTAAHGVAGALYLIPASLDAVDIARVVREGYDVALLGDGLRRLISELTLDVLLIDTHPGLNEETLLSIAMSDHLVIVMRPDQQDYEGTHVTVSVARRLKVPRTSLVVNRTPAAFDAVAVKRRVEEAYGTEVAAVLPHSEDLMALSSAGVFALRNPGHHLTTVYRLLMRRLLEPDPAAAEPRAAESR